MTTSTKERRESSIVTLDDAVRLIFRASKSKREILGETSNDTNQYIVPALDSDLFKVFEENFRIEIYRVADMAAIAAFNRIEEKQIVQEYGTHNLLRALYSPGGTVSLALQTAELHEHDWLTSLFDVGSKSIFWQCIDYLAEIGHPARFDTLVNRNARTETKDFNGVKVKNAFYTAAYRDGWNYGEPSRAIDIRGHFLVNTSPNHAETYVIEGAEVGLNDELRILIRTGNGIAGIKPSVRAVDKIGRVGGYAAYQTRGLPNEITEPLVRKLGLEEEYRRVEEMARALGAR